MMSLLMLHKAVSSPPFTKRTATQIEMIELDGRIASICTLFYALRYILINESGASLMYSRSVDVMAASQQARTRIRGNGSPFQKRHPLT